MPKYGWFSGVAKTPMQEFEGDYMQQDKDYVKIFKDSASGEMVGASQVAAIQLDKGQFVREL
jgi:hypothetical protein